MKAVILLPTFNERENIISLLDNLQKILAKNSGYNFNYLIIDDNSPDGTAEIVQNYSKSHKEVKIITGKKAGLGNALIRGINYATEKINTDLIIQMDADLSHDPEVIPKFLEKIDSGADMVVGSRYIKGGSIPSNWGIHRKIFSIIGNAIVRYGLGFPNIHDWTGGFRAYKKKIAVAVTPQMSKYSGYVFQIAFLHKTILLKSIIAEVPINFTDRRFGKSKIAPAEYIRHVFEYVISQRLNDLKTGSFGKFLVVGGTGLLINTFLLEVFVRLGLAPWISNTIGAECAIISNFILNNRWTFKSRKVNGLQAFVKLIQFNLTSIVGVLFIQSGTIWVGTYFAGVRTFRIWYLIGTAILLIWNYFMYSKVIWKKQN